VKGDKTEEYGAAGFVKKGEGLVGEMVEKQHCAYLVDEEQQQERI
jgi:hypothetical protein